jgi:hypothetical protein
VNALKKKYGPLPAWSWLAIAVTLGYIFYRYQKNAGESEGVEEGYFPTQGIPIEEVEASPGGGLQGLSEDLQALQAAGFVPAGSEEARGEGRFSPLEELLEEGFFNYLSGLMTPAGREAKAAARQGKKPGSKKPNRKGTAKGRGGRGGSNHHTAPTNHQAAAHPQRRMAVGRNRAVSRQRQNVGAGHQAGGGGNKKKGKKNRR